MIKASESESTERYVVDSDGNRVGVILDCDRYRELLDAAEELDAIRAYDAAQATDEDAVPFEQAVEEIERQRS